MEVSARHNPIAGGTRATVLWRRARTPDDSRATGALDIAIRPEHYQRLAEKSQASPKNASSPT